MRLKLFLGTLAAWAIMAACAGVPVKSGVLEMNITPAVLHPGDVVRVTVIAPLGTSQVIGRLDVPGSPRLPLKSTDGGRTWTFTTQIPVDAVWQPGRYRAQVQGVSPDGGTLTGETWITAP